MLRPRSGQDGTSPRTVVLSFALFFSGLHTAVLVGLCWGQSSSHFCNERSPQRHPQYRRPMCNTIFTPLTATTTSSAT